jgi:hypothetical protein
LTRDKGINITTKEIRKIDPVIFANLMRAHHPYLQHLLDRVHAGEYVAGQGI